MINNICYWIGRIAKDKILHFLLCYLIVDYCLSIGQHFNLSILLNSIIAFIVVSAIIFLKEIVDEKQYHGWNWYDILAGYIGVIAKAIAFIIQVV